MEKMPGEERDLLLSHMKAIEEYLIEHAQPLFPYQDWVKLLVAQIDSQTRFELYVFRDRVRARSNTACPAEAKALSNLEWDAQVCLLEKWQDVKDRLQQQLEAQAKETRFIRYFKV